MGGDLFSHAVPNPWRDTTTKVGSVPKYTGDDSKNQRTGSGPGAIDAALACTIDSVGVEWQSVSGVLTRGYGVASGPSADYPYGALERQIPIFKSLGLDLSAFFRGTLNVDIRPLIFHLVGPELTFRRVRWTDLHPPEDFSFSNCRVIFGGHGYDGWLYYPHPETKRRNFQNPSLLEVIAMEIPGVAPGSRLQVLLDSRRVSLERPPSPG
jgi:hypothetical protein